MNHFRSFIQYIQCKSTGGSGETDKEEGKSVHQINWVVQRRKEIEGACKYGDILMIGRRRDKGKKDGQNRPTLAGSQRTKEVCVGDVLSWKPAGPE